MSLISPAAEIEPCVWKEIDEFPTYLVSNYGEIWNLRTGRAMGLSKNNYGHVKVSLINDEGRYTRSVARLTALAYVSRPNPSCSDVIVLDGNLSDLRASNLAWRPKWFAWKYIQQFKGEQNSFYHNVPVFNSGTGREYISVAECAITEGLLMADVWRSTYQACCVFPHNHIYVLDRKSIISSGIHR